MAIRPRRAIGATVVALLAAGCSAGAETVTAARPELPVSVTARITTTTTTTSTTTTTTTTTTESPTTNRPRASTTTATTAPATPVVGRRALVIGDSVLLAARATIPSALPGWQVTVDAAQNRTIAAFASVLAAAGGPEGYGAVVVHLCTNYWQGGGFGRAFDRAMAALAAVPRVVWMTCSEWSSGPVEANAVIRRSAERYGNVAVADWAVMVGTPGYTWDDGIHLRPEGERAAAAAIAAAIGPA